MTADPAGFYDAAYAAAGERHARWRELGARGKAEHVVSLLARGGVAPESLVEVGCGDGALLAELRRRAVGSSLAGFDVSAEAIGAARARGLDRVEVFDGARLPVADDSYEVAVLSHVLEHVAEPVALLREAARAAPAVVVEVPLEASLSGRRASRRELSESIGHVQALDRAAARALVAGAGLRIEAELLDPLPVAVHAFFAESRVARTKAAMKGALRRVVFALSPALAMRLFTLHWACLARRSAPGS